MPRKKYDWDKIRTEYISGDDHTTLEALCSMHGCSIDTIKRRSSKENWVDQRTQYRHRVATKTQQKAAAKEAEIRVRHMQIARAMQEKALRKLVTVDPSGLSMSELRHWIRDATEIERKAAGIPDEFNIKDMGRDDLIRFIRERIEAVRGGAD